MNKDKYIGAVSELSSILTWINYSPYVDKESLIDFIILKMTAYESELYEGDEETYHPALDPELEEEEVENVFDKKLTIRNLNVGDTFDARTIGEGFFNGAEIWEDCKVVKTNYDEKSDYYAINIDCPNGHMDFIFDEHSWKVEIV